MSNEENERATVAETLLEMAAATTNANIPTPTVLTQNQTISKIQPGQAKTPSRQKNAPIAARGTLFTLQDNLNVDVKPLKKGIREPEKLKFKLLSTAGEFVQYKFPRRNGFDFDNTDHVADANKWRRQIIRRRLALVGPTRKVWTGKDMAVIAQHRDFRRSYVSNQAIREMAAQLPGRTPTAVRAMLGRLKRAEDIKSGTIHAFMKSIGDRASDKEDDDKSDGDTVKQEIGEDHGGKIDAGLEDSSDNEKDGQRTAAQPVSAIAVPPAY